MMTYIPCSQRVFPIKLTDVVTGCSRAYLHWLKNLLRRLGKECTLRVWENAYKNYDDTFLKKILSTGWLDIPGKDAVDTEPLIARLISQKFFSPVEKVSGSEARQIIETAPPLYLVKQLFPSLNAWRDITTYEALHLQEDGLSLLVESLIDLHKKEGELLAYDTLMSYIIENNTQKMSAYEFMSSFLERYRSTPDKANIYSAGVETKIIKGSKTGILMHITECEFARYYREYHPRVGYMMACSLDHAAYSACNKNIWLQRTSTLMEGGKNCNFRVYTVRDIPTFDNDLGVR
jgi:hypothetical protein